MATRAGICLALIAVTAVLTTAGLTAADAHEASNVEPKPAALSAPADSAGLAFVIAAPAKS